MFEIPAQIKKADIEKYGIVRAAFNADEFVIDLADKAFPAKTLRYVGFAGSLTPNGMYVGVHRFESAEWSPNDAIVSFAAMFEGVT